MDIKEVEIFSGKNVSQLMEEIYRNSLDKKTQIDIIVSELRGLVKGINDAVMIVPLIKDQFDVGVRNDEQLIKLLAIVQRIYAKSESGNSDGSGFSITDEEKQALLEEIDAINKIDKKNSDILDKKNKSK